MAAVTFALLALPAVARAADPSMISDDPKVISSGGSDPPPALTTAAMAHGSVIYFDASGCKCRIDFKVFDDHGSNPACGNCDYRNITGACCAVSVDCVTIAPEAGHVLFCGRALTSKPKGHLAAGPAVLPDDPVSPPSGGPLKWLYVFAEQGKANGSKTDAVRTFFSASDPSCLVKNALCPQVKPLEIKKSKIHIHTAKIKKGLAAAEFAWGDLENDLAFDDFDAEFPTSTEARSWGALKSLYRR
ncbi:MAG: hypothetical protein A2W00_05585 [Candidatus Eisenbacteria bacterium RBG_16_71_46]|nr:MAG: hypothetical protein A2W00_05585 [Candidatus Eisenbacteria bacterium RBG_16_71_46]OGF25473.1 MAG: hypothetical protein A2V63_00365 [Candidatus Eisenbacteria bacterium RBG_19FT_COMBO_70_11]